MALPEPQPLRAPGICEMARLRPGQMDGAPHGDRSVFNHGGGAEKGIATAQFRVDGDAQDRAGCGIDGDHALVARCLVIGLNLFGPGNIRDLLRRACAPAVSELGAPNRFDIERKWEVTA